MVLSKGGTDYTLDDKSITVVTDGTTSALPHSGFSISTDGELKFVLRIPITMNGPGQSVEISGTYNYLVDGVFPRNNLRLQYITMVQVDVTYLSRDKSIRFDADGDTLSVVPGSVSSPNGNVTVDEYALCLYA